MTPRRVVFLAVAAGCRYWPVAAFAVVLAAPAPVFGLYAGLVAGVLVGLWLDAAQHAVLVGVERAGAWAQGIRWGVEHGSADGSETSGGGTPPARPEAEDGVPPHVTDPRRIPWPTPEGDLLRVP